MSEVAIKSGLALLDDAVRTYQTTIRHPDLRGKRRD